LHTNAAESPGTLSDLNALHAFSACFILALGERVTPVSGVDVWLDPERVECHLLEYNIFAGLFQNPVL